METQEDGKNKKQTTVIITIVVMVALGYYFYNDLKKTKESVSLSTPVVNIDKATTTTSTKKEETKTVVISAKIPSLDRPIVYPDNMDPKIKEDTSIKIAKILGGLRANSDSFNDWIDLGLYRKILGDYEGAGEVWEYASTIRPKSTSAFSNLGVLYGYYLNSPVLAEKNFLRAIGNDPTYLNTYFQVYDFYKDVMKDSSKARAIIEAGLKSSPNSKELKDFLDEINKTPST